MNQHNPYQSPQTADPPAKRSSVPWWRMRSTWVAMIILTVWIAAIGLWVLAVKISSYPH